MDPLQAENGIPEYNSGKRKIIWRLKNVKGQQTKTLDLSLTYEPGVVIDDLQFKQLGPFNIDFDIEVHGSHHNDLEDDSDRRKPKNSS